MTLAGGVKMANLHPLLVVLLSYLVGSIPFGVILGSRLGGLDVRKHGSGNIGATNVLRTLGLGFAVCTFLLDTAKGAFALWLARSSGLGPAWIAAAGAAVVVGHNWPVWLAFRGGKGIATTFGFLLFAMPSVGIVVAVVWVAVIVAFRYASVASMVAIACSPIAAFLAGYPREYTLVCLLFALSAVIRHISNIRRLLSGTENKFVLKLR
ncbi:MAG TPA: glycerol-3-phosphate 1-O-acyltransferase PlsY [Bacillota bacterium]|jgi:glycerol-3-phosphate acyltransferase PlsY|nr:glycerol-3-phosphate 1-O-acyltransferase PlsY [Bacillota bacterium]